MSDNFYSTTMTPSAPGALNIVSGQTHGVEPPNLVVNGDIITIDGTLIADIDPAFDKCSMAPTVAMTGKWEKMVIFIVFDDSGGWYDHVMPPIINQSQTPADALVSPGNAGNTPPFGNYQGRLAYGMRLPFLIISPFVKSNYVDHTLNNQTSVLRFIENNWKLGRIGDFSFDELAGSLRHFF
jgi:hypothetical protein